MPRENPDYRPTLEMLQETFPGRGAISLSQAAQYIGKKKDTLLADPTFPRLLIGSHYSVNLAGFARYLSRSRT